MQKHDLRVHQQEKTVTKTACKIISVYFQSVTLLWAIIMVIRSSTSTPASSASSGSTPSVRMTPSVRAAGVIAPVSPISVYRPRTLHISTAWWYGPTLISLAHICNTDYRSYHSCQATKLKYRHHDYWWMCQNIPSKKCYPFESWIGEHFHAGSMILAEKANIMLKISLLQSSTSCNHYPCYIGCCWLDRFVWT